MTQEPWKRPIPVSLLARVTWGCCHQGQALRLTLPLPEAVCFARELVFREQERMTLLSVGVCREQEGSRRLRPKPPDTDQFVA